MNVEKWIVAHFSPTGGTKKIADAIAAGFDTPVEEMAFKRSAVRSRSSAAKQQQAPVRVPVAISSVNHQFYFEHHLELFPDQRASEFLSFFSIDMGSIFSPTTPSYVLCCNIHDLSGFKALSHPSVINTKLISCTTESLPDPAYVSPFAAAQQYYAASILR